MEGKGWKGERVGITIDIVKGEGWDGRVGGGGI